MTSPKAYCTEEIICDMQMTMISGAVQDSINADAVFLNRICRIWFENSESSMAQGAEIIKLIRSVAEMHPLSRFLSPRVIQRVITGRIDTQKEESMPMGRLKTVIA